MKKVIIFIISILVVVLFTIIICLILLTKGNKVNNNVNNDVVNNTDNINNSTEENVVETHKFVLENEIAVQEAEEVPEIEYNENPEVVNNSTYFFTVQDCIDKYITQANGSLINILDMLQLNEENTKLVKFAVRSVLVDEQLQVKYFNCIVYLDYNDLAYKIEPIDSTITNLKDVNLKNGVNTIEKNEDNSFVFTTKTEKDEIDSYFTRFKLMLLNTPSIAFQYLDEEYRTNRFENLDDFKNYIEENETAIIHIRIEKFEEKQEDGYIKYICQDSTERYYTLNVKDMTHFTFEFGATI